MGDGKGRDLEDWFCTMTKCLRRRHVSRRWWTNPLDMSRFSQSNGTSHSAGGWSVTEPIGRKWDCTLMTLLRLGANMSAIMRRERINTGAPRGVSWLPISVIVGGCMSG